MDFLVAGVAILGAYLLGAVPFSYVLGRLRGVDLTQVGTRNVGATNLAHEAGWAVAVIALLLDMGKGWLPAWGCKALGLGEGVAVAAALAAVVGHSWPIYLRFRGGRGNATGFGAILNLAPLALAGACVPFALGTFSGYTGAGMLTGFVALPLLALLTGESPVVAWGLLVFLGVVLARRLTAQGVREAVAAAPDPRRALVNLLLHDNITGTRRGARAEE
jgi:glycerol-3-phosphate acyltransferase PlsY